ncbi:hypothetical protein AWJ14_06385 [Hoeflea olei]|uniref:J domain-containing protein n=1 Tax=Hoeflea olei TaxID=1480615 RepID=A0A1C1YPX9_9HYPH|nr:hypothetical protein AWJ14_06385 [Hoeflea olei]
MLGLSRTAKPDEIKNAYRQLAKTWHPDQNQGDPEAGNRFAEISHAYRLLIDPDMRLKFDNGHIDARGRKRTRPMRGFAANPFKAFKQAMASGTAASAGAAASGQPADTPGDASFEEMVSHIFGDAAAREPKQAPDRATTSRRRSQSDAPGMDEDPLDALDALFEKWKTRHKPQAAAPVSRHHVEIDLKAALTGSRAEITLADGTTVGFEVPAGTVDGAEIEVPAPAASALGPAVVTVRHRKHPTFRSLGADIHGEQTIELAEAVLGGSILFEGLDGPLRLAVPAWSGSDTVLRVQDKGLPTAGGGRGALLVHLRVVLPETPDQQLIDLMRISRKAIYV